MAARHRTALISDIHGNQLALQAVLRDIERRGADEIVCLGDVANLGAAPREVVETVQGLGCRCIRGNHDDYLLDPRLIDSHSDSPIIVAAIDWCREELTGEQLEFIRGFEDGFELPLGDSSRLMLFHGSPSSNVVDLLAYTDAETFDDQLGDKRATVMAGGHTHVQMIRQHRGALVVNPGSVGAPFREFVSGSMPTIMPHAEYATVESFGNDVDVTLHRVALDKRAQARAALDSTNPMSTFLAQPYL